MANTQGQDEYDLHEAWEKACRSFAATAKFDLRQDRALTPEEVISQLKAKRQKDDEKSAEFKVLKDVLWKSLTCIQTLGGIAAQGAGMVFGPSTLCFNAVSYLITAGQNYKNIFSSLAELLKQVSDVLERFVVYLQMKEVDLPLRKIAHEMLLAFVSICEFSVHVLHGNKILKALKVFAFSDDDGVNAKIAFLKGLVEREAQMKTTLTYRSVKEGFGETKEAVSGVKSIVDKIAEDNKKRDAETFKQKQLDKIKRTLNVHAEVEQQIESHSHLVSDTVAGTGHWVQEDQFHAEYADRSSDWSKVLFISGPEGYGKSFLVTTIVHELEKRYLRQSGDVSRTSVAYFYMARDSKKSSSTEKEGVSISKLLKSLAWQFTQDPVYLKDLAAMCDGWVEPDTTEELIIRLFEPCFCSQETFYIAVDAIDQMDDRDIKILQQLLTSMQARYRKDQLSRVRFLLSGRAKALDDVKNDDDLDSATIDVAANNRQDIERFIQDRLDNMKLLQGGSDQVKALREEIFSTLSEGASGDFINVDMLLKEIGTKQWPAEIREVLSKAQEGANRSETIAREVKRCNQRMNPRQIRDLNLLLTWVICSKRTLTVAELKVVLFLHSKEASLLPLYDQIRQHYSAFFNLDDPDHLGQDTVTVSLVSDSIRDYFRNISDSRKAEETVDSSRILASEVKIVKRFLESICDDELYSKFGFDDFFNRKLSSNTAVVQVDLENASMILLQGCLEVISRSPEKEVEPLFHYAVSYFADYMREIDLAVTHPTDKASIGRYLVAMFNNPETIGKWWSGKVPSLPHAWYYTEANVDVVLNWFKDSAVIRSYSSDEKEWIKKLTSNSSPDNDLLEHASRYIADFLFRSNAPGWGLEPLLRCLHAFLSKLRHRRDASTPGISSDMGETTISADDIYKVSQWAADVLQVTDLDYEWTRRLARAFRDLKHYDEAVKQFHITAGLRDDHWFSDFGLAQTYEGLEQWQSAADLLESVLARIQKGEAKDPAPAPFMSKLRLALANDYKKLGQHDRVMQLYEQQLESNPSDYDTMLEKVLLLATQAQARQLIQFLEQLRDQQDPAFGISRLSRLYHENIFNDNYSGSIVEAASQTESFPFIKSAYQTALDDTMRSNYLPDDVHAKAHYRVGVLCDFAEVLFIRSPEDRENAIELWERCAADAVDINWDLPRQIAGKRLAVVYHDQARQASPDSPEVKETLQKLTQLSVGDYLDRDAWFSTIDPQLLVGRYYSALGREQEAMECIKGHIKVGVDLLSDNDPSNDWQGFLWLASSLMYAGDDDNALAAWSLIGPSRPHEEGGEGGGDGAHPQTTGMNGTHGDADKFAEENGGTTGSEDDSPVNSSTATPRPGMEPRRKTWTGVWSSDESEGPLGYTCDGQCGQEWTFADDFYVCKDCLDVMFDEDCVHLRRENRLKTNVCDSHHEFLHVPKWDFQEARERGSGNVRLRGEIVAVPDWLDDIKHKWGL